MSYEFIQDLSEARLFRNQKNLPNVGIGTLAENMFTAALALQIMKYENPKVAKTYAQRTLAGGLTGWRSNGSDLSNLYQVIANPERYQDRVDMNKKVSLPELQFKTWLRNIAQSKYDVETDRRFFLAMQRQLSVRSPGLISARRVVADWPNADRSERASTVMKVHRGMGLGLKQADLFAPFARVAMKKGADTAKTGGIPLWAKLAAAGAGGYYLGKKIGSW